MTPWSAEIRIESGSSGETERIGEFLGTRLAPGDLVALEGPLGAGKTTFIRGLARGLDVPEGEISSPTFVYVHEHLGRVRFIHADLYRTEHPGDIDDLEIFEYMNAECVVALEWADKAPDALPEGILWICFSEGDSESDRRIAVSADGNRHRETLRHLEEEFCGNKPSARY